MNELKWNWAYLPYLDAPEKQQESALHAGYIKVVNKDEADRVIAELKDKCQMHDFFWDGCGFARRGFKNTITVSEAFDKLESDNHRLKRALWLARADRAMMILDYFTLKCRWFKDYMKIEPPQCDVKMVHKWANVERKCRAKAEEYK